MEYILQLSQERTGKILAFFKNITADFADNEWARVLQKTTSVAPTRAGWNQEVHVTSCVRQKIKKVDWKPSQQALGRFSNGRLVDATELHQQLEQPMVDQQPK